MKSLYEKKKKAAMNYVVAFSFLCKNKVISVCHQLCNNVHSHQSKPIKHKKLRLQNCINWGNRERNRKVKSKH